MPRDGGFHPFKGKVSRHFGDSVCDILFPMMSRACDDFPWVQGGIRKEAMEADEACG